MQRVRVKTQNDVMQATIVQGDTKERALIDILSSFYLFPAPNPPPFNAIPGILRATRSCRGWRLHADLLCFLPSVQADLDSGAHHLGARAPGIFRHVARGDSIRQNYGIPCGVYRPFPLRLCRCGEVINFENTLLGSRRRRNGITNGTRTKRKGKNRL